MMDALSGERHKLHKLHKLQMHQSGRRRSSGSGGRETRGKPVPEEKVIKIA